ncbi:Alpha-xylosidase 1-like protein [Drosera capensis]
MAEVILNGDGGSTSSIDAACFGDLLTLRDSLADENCNRRRHAFLVSNLHLAPNQPLQRWAKGIVRCPLKRHETKVRLRMHITDAEKSRWEVPYTLLPREGPPPLKQNICRWDYHNLYVVKGVVEGYKNAKIPLGVIWNDDDHMDGHKDFTLNPVSYPRPKLLEFLEMVHDRSMHYVVLINPGIAVNSSYGVYQRGLANDVFIKYHGEPYLAQVWPAAVNFPDYLNPKTVDWWVDEVRRFHDLVPVDGLWIDTNEASNFCSGLCKIPEGKQCPMGTGPGWICCLECKNITNTRWDDPPYKINASGASVPIGFKTLATSAEHYNGVLEYDAHSLYGLSETVAIHKGLLAIKGERPFILTRSTFVGTGHNAATLDWRQSGYFQ